MTRGSIDRIIFTSGFELGGHLIRDINLLYYHFIAGLGVPLAGDCFLQEKTSFLINMLALTDDDRSESMISTVKSLSYP